MTWTRRALAALATVGIGLLPPAARADAVDPEASRIVAAGHSLEWNWTPPERSDRYGHAETLIHAPISAVRTRVLDYAHYKDILPSHFKTSRVVAHGQDGAADVYIRVVVMHEMLTLWDVTRFAPVSRPLPGFELVAGRMVPGKGNVDDLEVVWTMHAIEDEWTVLKLDLLLKSGLHAPQATIDEGLRHSARYAVDSIHDRAQGSTGIEPWPG
jgi:hypothetical protein